MDERVVELRVAQLVDDVPSVMVPPRSPITAIATGPGVSQNVLVDRSVIANAATGGTDVKRRKRISFRSLMGSLVGGLVVELEGLGL